MSQFQVYMHSLHIYCNSTTCSLYLSKAFWTIISHILLTQFYCTSTTAPTHLTSPQLFAFSSPFSHFLPIMQILANLSIAGLFLFLIPILASDYPSSKVIYQNLFVKIRDVVCHDKYPDGNQDLLKVNTRKMCCEVARKSSAGEFLRCVPCKLICLVFFNQNLFSPLIFHRSSFIIPLFSISAIRFFYFAIVGFKSLSPHIIKIFIFL